MISQFADIIWNFFFFLMLFCFFCQLSYWSKFHVNIITSSGVMIIFFYQGLIRNPEIRNTTILSFAQYLRTGAGKLIRIPNLARRSLIKCYRMLQNIRVTAFTVFGLLRESQQGEIKSPPIQIRINLC